MNFSFDYYLKNVYESKKVYESEDESSNKIKLKGYKASEIIERIEELMEIMPDKVKFGVPADNKGQALTYRDANGAIQKIQDIEHYYSSKNEPVRFYCWSINYAGNWDATQSLREKINKFGGFGNEQNMNLHKVIEYFKKNQEDTNSVRSISISIDSPSIRKAQKNNDEAEELYPQPDDMKKEENSQEDEDKNKD